MRTYQMISPLVIMALLIVAVEAGTKRAPPQEPQANTVAILKEFPSDQHMGRHWRNIVISPNNSIEALTALAKRLHHDNPKTWFRIFTDGNDQQFRKYMLWNMHYASDKGPQHPYPEAWANRHAIAMIHPGARDPRPGRSDFRPHLTMLLGSGVTPPVDVGYTVDLD
jgi:hypothetical protein